MPNESNTGILLDYFNRSYHKGTNTRLNGRLLDDAEASFILNADITTVGNRTKKMSPVLVVTLGEITVLFIASPNLVWMVTVDDSGQLGLLPAPGAISDTVLVAGPNTYWQMVADDDGQIVPEQTTPVITQPILLSSDTLRWLVTVDDDGQFGTIAA